jgi:hypothetical protein
MDSWTAEGEAEGKEGENVGEIETVGPELMGNNEGAKEGAKEGAREGAKEGAREGASEGGAEGATEGVKDGLIEGLNEAVTAVHELYWPQNTAF